MPRFNGKNIFVTITNITKNFGTSESDALVQSLFSEFQRVPAWFAWEKSKESNDHIHIVYMLENSKSFSRKAFSPLLDSFGTLALNIQTFSRKQTYKNAITGKTHRGKPALWLFEKLCYCSAPSHQEYFDTAKWSVKRPTVVRIVKDINMKEYGVLKSGFDAWLSEKTSDKREKPADEMFNRIYAGCDRDELHDIYSDAQQGIQLRKYILSNYDKLVIMIDTHETIRDARRREQDYPVQSAGYRPFQKELAAVLDTQNDRNIHAHVDAGKTGKNHFCSTENLRSDTCVIQSAKTCDIAYVWNPKKHKRIIIDVPRGKMQYLNTSAIEKLKNGQIMSTKYRPKFKQSFGFKPTVLILGNELIPRETWTDDRLTESWTSEDVGFEMKMVEKKTDDSDAEESFFDIFD